MPLINACLVLLQDAVEYFQHLLELMTKEEKVHKDRLGTALDLPPFTADSFTFKTEDRIQCLQTKAVSYSTGITTNIGLVIPLEEATNSAELEEYKVGDLYLDPKLDVV